MHSLSDCRSSIHSHKVLPAKSLFWYWWAPWAQGEEADPGQLLCRSWMSWEHSGAGRSPLTPLWQGNTGPRQAHICIIGCGVFVLLGLWKHDETKQQARRISFVILSQPTSHTTKKSYLLTKLLPARMKCSWPCVGSNSSHGPYLSQRSLTPQSVIHGKLY